MLLQISMIFFTPVLHIREVWKSIQVTDQCISFIHGKTDGHTHNYHQMQAEKK